MGKYSEQIEIKKAIKEKDKVRREKLAVYFFDLSKLSFAGLVIGVIFPLFTNVGDVKFWSVAILGTTLTIISALVANKILR